MPVLKLTLGSGTLILQAIQRMNGLIQMRKWRNLGKNKKRNKKGLFNGPRRTLGDLTEM